MTSENQAEITNWDTLADDPEELTPSEINDDCLDALVPDEDQRDLLPEPGDFWIGDDLLEARRSAA